MVVVGGAQPRLDAAILVVFIDVRVGLGLPFDMEMRGHIALGWLGGTLVDTLLDDVNGCFHRLESKSSDRVVLNHRWLGWDKRLHNRGRLCRRSRARGDVSAVAIAAMIVVSGKGWYGM